MILSKDMYLLIYVIIFHIRKLNIYVSQPVFSRMLCNSIIDNLNKQRRAKLKRAMISYW